MTRKKVKLMWIVNDTARKASLKKRRVSLLKKVSELTTLCDLNAFVVIYGSDDSEPALWPSRPVVQQLLTRFQNMPDIERCKKMMNQESYLKERIGKMHEQNKKLQMRSKELEMTYLMHQLYQEKGFDHFEINELHSLFWLVEEKMKEIRKRVEYFEQVPHIPSDPFLPQGPKMDEIGQIEGGTSSKDRRNYPNDANPTMWDQWFIDLMNNNQNHIASCSNTKNDIGLPHPHIGGSFSGGVDLGLHHGNISANSNNGNNFDLGLIPNNIGGSNNENNFDMGLPIGNLRDRNFVALGLTQGNIGGDGLGVGLPYGNIGGSDIGGNAFQGLRLPYCNIRGISTGGNIFPGLSPSCNGNTESSNSGRNDTKLPNFFGNSSDMGL